MNRKHVSAFAATAAAAVVGAIATIAAPNARADDITIETKPFVSSRSHQEVRAEVMGQAELLRIRNSEWGAQSLVVAPRSSYTVEEARSDYLAQGKARNALYGEDSGSTYLWKMRPLPQTEAMGGPAR